MTEHDSEPPTGPVRPDRSVRPDRRRLPGRHPAWRPDRRPGRRPDRYPDRRRWPDRGGAPRPVRVLQDFTQGDTCLDYSFKNNLLHKRYIDTRRCGKSFPCNRIAVKAHFLQGCEHRPVRSEKVDQRSFR